MEFGNKSCSGCWVERWQQKAGIIHRKKGECFESEFVPRWNNLLNAVGVLLVAFLKNNDLFCYF